MKVAMIIMAAGNSRRFGENKLLFELDGVPMYKRTLKELIRGKELLENKLPDLSCKLILVSQYPEILAYGKEQGMRALRNPHPERGISSTIKIGLEEGKDTQAALFAVADQPWLRGDTVMRLTEMLLSTKKGIVCPAVMENDKPRLGNPCYFTRKYYPELLSLTGDVGGKQVVKRHLEDTRLFYLEEKKELEDIDYKSELYYK